jgi:hypothetical protein
MHLDQSADDALCAVLKPSALPTFLSHTLPSATAPKELRPFHLETPSPTSHGVSMREPWEQCVAEAGGNGSVDVVARWLDAPKDPTRRNAGHGWTASG